MALTLGGLCSTFGQEEQELNRAIAKIALLKGLNTKERKIVAVRQNAGDIAEKEDRNLQKKAREQV